MNCLMSRLLASPKAMVQLSLTSPLGVDTQSVMQLGYSIVQ